MKLGILLEVGNHNYINMLHIEFKIKIQIKIEINIQIKPKLHQDKNEFKHYIFISNEKESPI